MKIKMEQLPANNPAFSVGKDRTVLYSNVASGPLLNKWGAKIEANCLPISEILFKG